MRTERNRSRTKQLSTRTRTKCSFDRYSPSSILIICDRNTCLIVPLLLQLKEELENLKKAMMENMDLRPQSRGGGNSLGDAGISTPPLDTAREHEVASIREQLEEHQRLLQESEVCLVWFRPW
jgi:hypothetical protein